MSGSRGRAAWSPYSAVFSDSANDSIVRDTGQIVGTNSGTGVLIARFSINSSVTAADHYAFDWAFDRVTLRYDGAIDKMHLVCRNSSGVSMVSHLSPAAHFSKDTIYSIGFSFNQNFSWTGQSYDTSNPCQVTITGHGMSDGELLYIKGSTGTDIDGQYNIIVVDANTIELIGVDNSAGTGGTCSVMARICAVVDGEIMNWEPSVFVPYSAGTNEVDWDASQQHCVGADNDGSAPFWHGCLGPLAVDDGVLDLNDATIRENIWDSDGNLKDPGPDGSNWFGFQPLLLFQHPAKDFETNTGSDSGTWNAPTVQLTDCTL